MERRITFSGNLNFICTLMVLLVGKFSNQVLITSAESGIYSLYVFHLIQGSGWNPCVISQFKLHPLLSPFCAIYIISNYSFLWLDLIASRPISRGKENKTMDMEQGELQFSGFFGICKESFKIINIWMKIFTQISLGLVLPLPILFLTQIQLSDLLFAKVCHP